LRISTLAAHSAHLADDPIIAYHLSQLYDLLLQENICRIIEPYSVVETAHIATLMQLPILKIEEKLSQMILDKKFNGILDAGADCLIVYEDQVPDTTYEQSLETLSNMGRVVDALSLKANLLVQSNDGKFAEQSKKQDKEEKREKDAETKKGSA